MLQDWTSILAAESTPILEAIRMIEAGHLQFLLIHRDGKLVGTATDGDVRRGILAGIGLDCPVSEIMNRSPLTVQSNVSDDGALGIMRRHSIHQLPVVDPDNRIIGVKLIGDLTQTALDDNWVVLMAGGRGTRLKPFTDDVPKPLIKVGDKPILETILKNFVLAGFSRFFISVHYKAEMIEDYFGDGSSLGIKISYLRESDSLGTAGALSLLSERPQKPFFVMNSDLLTTVNFHQMIKYHEERQSRITLCVREHAMTIPFGVVDFKDHELVGIREKPTEKYFVNAGIYVLDPVALDYIKPGEPLDMPDLITRMRADGERAVVFPLHEYWLDVGRLDDLKRASAEYQGIFG